MKEKNDALNMKNSLHAIPDLMASNPGLNALIKRMNEPDMIALRKATASVSGLGKGLHTLADILQENTASVAPVSEALASLGKALPAMDPDVLSAAANVATLYGDALRHMQESVPTPAIASLQKAFKSDAYLKGVQEFGRTLNQPVIESQDLALVKLSEPMRQVLDGRLQKGVPSLLDQMHVGTAEKLKRIDTISYSVDRKAFFSEARPENRAAVAEMNIICSGADLLPEFSPDELLNFLCELDNERTFASRHPIGEKIYAFVQSWHSVMDFDRERYYHARKLGKGDDYYKDDEMCRAPAGVTGHGRYNWPGKSYYYFSDQETGAILEIRKHVDKADRPYRIQVVTVKPTKSIKLLDLSMEDKGNHFLRALRTPLKSDTKREYLLPCFVGECCRRHNLDGIKYYGAKKYNNYVTWADGYFKVVDRAFRDCD